MLKKERERKWGGKRERETEREKEGRKEGGGERYADEDES